MKIILDKTSKTKTQQFTTFYLAGDLYGIDVIKVQEVTRSLSVTQMRTAPPYIKGLINLRGQIATGIGLHELLGLPLNEGEKMTIVCRSEDMLLSLFVDCCGDVIDAVETNFEPVPNTVPVNVRKFMDGIYKLDNTIISILNLDSIITELEKKCA